MKFKKILLYFSLLAVVYIGIGGFLLYTEKIQRLYIFPGWSIKYGPTDEDNSTLSADGPVIVYENGKIIQYQLFPKEETVISYRKEIQKSDTLTCYINETQDTFRFQLKDSLKIEPAAYVLPEKMLVISDIEGNFKAFKSILLGNKVINSKLNWSFGANHLVLVGDFFDRGLQVTECLWLIYKLEKEAEEMGGKVHFILGNHEMMNLKGQFKYVRDKYFINSDTLRLDYTKWFSQQTELGRWLRTKNGIEKIGDYLVVHAGISSDFPKNYDLKQINDSIRRAIDKLYTPEELQKSDVFIGIASPLWYRGIAQEKESQTNVDNILSNYNASKMIIGHTIMEEIKYLYNKKVIAIDLDHSTNSDNGYKYALWFENKEFKITDQNAKKKELK
jgi:Calcineurin-like phosphoesterase